MSETILLRLDGDVSEARALSFAELSAIDPSFQIDDVGRLDAKRRGGAVRLAGLIELAGVKPTARYVTLHAASDDFHASVPLDAVRERAVLIYRLDDAPLAASAGGPVRFLILDSAACNTHEIDECANVKFVDRIEFSAQRGQDNRPSEAEEHAELHRRQQMQSGEGRGST